MNRFLLFLLLTFAAPGLYAQVQYATPNPRIEDANDPDVTIQRVELTKEYTIVYMKFQQVRQSYRRSMPRMFSLPSESNIGLQASTKLYVNQGERSYKLIRAENIPSEMRRKVAPGEQVDFVAYFERIDPGYTVFDLFECKDYIDQKGGAITCFNFWGVHIINPARQQYSQRPQPKTQPRATPAPPKQAPAPQPPVAVAPAVIAINGVTRDAKTKDPVQATLTYRLISGAEVTGDGPADSTRSAIPSGAYSIPVETRGVYVVTASAKGYFSQSDTLATNRVNISRDFNLVPIEAGARITLKNIYFNVSKYDLKSESYPELERLVGIMRDNPTMRIKLEGHTDIVGDFDANVELSRNRVDEVKRYLVSKGINSDRVETVGYGPSRPINTNRSLKERPENRRVELVIVQA
ncbi:OmpA family protein [Spirosoma sp. KUDC1026]|uniref:OmpA family protein n=1 Tax=Spirosoma sp. KUDC1026 TaxID=2745947 RepID=UPI00159BC356|nr:OmpA family protein [Spirosoma sp. KUDC1026]QKZ11350.1 OmpA family protein [Spirosoma sp. KUDC1026]